jgi:hypothetical protein
MPSETMALLEEVLLPFYSDRSYTVRHTAATTVTSMLVTNVEVIT